MQTSDQVLHTRWIAERDAQAFKALSAKYCRMIYGTSVRILRNSADAEEITQECFAALASAKTSPHGCMGAWLHRIATYQSLNRRRSDQRRRQREERFAHTHAAVTEAQWDDINQFIDECIERLPTNIRVAIVAHFIEDESVTAIASREGVTHSAISQRIQKGVRLIRDRMRRNGILVGATALATMMANQASAWPTAPPHLSEYLGKLALSGAHPMAADAVGAPFIGKTLVGAAAALAIVVLGSLYVKLYPSQPDSTIHNGATNQDSVVAPVVDQTPPAAKSVAVAPPAELTPVLVIEKTTETEPEPWTWRDVVDAYAAHQDRIRRIRFDFEHVSKGDYYWQSYAPEPGYREFFKSGTLTTDGERCAMQQLSWGHSFGGATLSADHADFGSYAFDGDTYIECAGMVQIHPNARNSAIRNSAFRNGRTYLLFSRYPGGPMLGLPLDEGWRIEELLYSAHQVALRSEKETVRETECYVVDADTDYGNISVWFDPERDFNIAQSIVGMGPGDIYETNPLPNDTSAYYEYVADRFVQVDGLWVPTEATLRQVACLLGGNGHDYTHRHKRSNIELLREGEDDDAYVIYEEDIPNGTQLMEINVVKRPGDPKWLWYNDRFVLTSDQPGDRSVRLPSNGHSFGAGMIAGGKAE